MAQQDGFLAALLQNLTGDAALKAAAFGLPGGASAATPVLGQDGSISFAQPAAPQGRFAGLKQGVQKALPYVGDVLSAIAASDPENGKGWAGQAIGSVVQRRNVEQWNDLQNRLRQAQVLQEQQQQQKLRQENATLLKAAGVDVGDSSFNKLDDSLKAADLISKQAGSNILYQLSTGVDPSQITGTENALIDSSGLNQLAARFATVADTNATLRGLPGAQGAGLDPTGKFPGGLPAQTPQTPQLQEDNSQEIVLTKDGSNLPFKPKETGFLAGLTQGLEQPTTISAGASANAPPPNPYTIGVANPDTLLKGFNTGVTQLDNNRRNALGQGQLVLDTKKLSETARSNRADEVLRSKAISETIRSNRAGEGLRGAEVAISKANSEATIAAKKAEAGGNPVASKQLLAVNQSINTLYKGLKDGLYKGDAKEAALAQLDGLRQDQQALVDSVVNVSAPASRPVVSAPTPSASSGGAAAAYRRKIGLGG